MRKILLLLLFFPLPHYTRLFIDFSELSYADTLSSLQNMQISNTAVVMRHPYQRITKTAILTDVLTNYHKQNLQRLQQEQALLGNKIYFILDPFSMSHNILFSISNKGGFIPDFKKKNETKAFIDRLLVISQHKQYGLVVDLGVIDLQDRKKVEKIILKALPDTVFFNGSKNTISDLYFNDFVVNFHNPKKIPKQAKNTIHKADSSSYNGDNASLVFWMLSQQYSVFLPHNLLQNQYIFQLAQIAYHSKKDFSVEELGDKHILIYNDEFIATVNLGSKFGIQKISKAPLYNVSHIKNVQGSSPLTIEDDTMTFITWPQSILIWQYKQ